MSRCTYKQLRKRREDIQSTRTYLMSELDFVRCDHPILPFYLTSAGCSEVPESVQKTGALGLHLVLSEGAFQVRPSWPSSSVGVHLYAIE
jgi:hypothetical protein